jgi:hypothetical protein
MQGENKKAALKLGIDAKLIEEKANTKKNLEILGNDLTFISIKEHQRTKHIACTRILESLFLN